MKTKFALGIFLITLVLALLKGAFKEPELLFLNGDSANWSDFSGDWVVVNYFAQWCAPCLREIPELNQFYSDSEGKPIRVIGVSFDSLSAVELMDIRAQYKIEFPLLNPEYANVFLNNMPRSLPATFIISPEGVVVNTLFGEQTSESLIHAVEGWNTAL